MTQPIPPSHVARLDQVRAELADIVDDARAHIAGCDAMPAGMCLGRDVVAYLVMLTCGERFELLQEAVSRLARAAADNQDGGTT